MSQFFNREIFCARLLLVSSTHRAQVPEKRKNARFNRKKGLKPSQTHGNIIKETLHLMNSVTCFWQVYNNKDLSNTTTCTITRPIEYRVSPYLIAAQPYKGGILRLCKRNQWKEYLTKAPPPVPLSKEELQTGRNPMESILVKLHLIPPGNKRRS